MHVNTVYRHLCHVFAPSDFLALSDTVQLSQVRPTTKATWSVSRRRDMISEFRVNNSRLLGVAGFCSLTIKRFLSGTVWSQKAAARLTSDKLNGLLGAADAFRWLNLVTES